jgi:small subunit ribosomal protein S1
MIEQDPHQTTDAAESASSVQAQPTQAEQPGLSPQGSTSAVDPSGSASAAESASESEDLDQLMAEAEQANQSATAPDQAPAQPAAGQAADASAGDQAADESHEEVLHHDMRRGRISAIRGEDVFVDLPGDTGKLQGVVPLTQFDRTPRIGSIMDFVVDHTDEHQGLIYLSREGAISRTTWEQLQRGASVEARVLSSNKGGLELEMVGGIRAFMPASQIDTQHVEDMQSWVGQKLPGIVQEIDRKSKKVVLSRRQYLEQEAARKKQALLSELEEGQFRDGKVSSLTKFGAFVDIGGVDGLIHVSDLSYSHIDKPGDVVQVGQDVRVKVLSIDREKERISLGLKQSQPDPWESIETRYQVGSQVQGRVVRTANFGAFVELEPGVEGLLPLSEMSWRRIHKAEEIVKAGDTLWMQVLSLDPANRKISLSLKQAQGDPWVGAEHKYPVGSWVEGTVRSLTDFGAFIELEPGVEGLAHISELAPHRVKQVSDVLQQGETRQVRVLEVSEDDRKIRLSLKSDEHTAQAQQQAAQHGQGGPAQQNSKKPAQGKAKQRQKKDHLRGGMDVGGVGLGGLRPEDFK